MLPNIKKLKVYSKSKIIHAMRVIDNNSQGTCFVVNDKNFLIGVLTDGDIRRALLNKMSTNLNVLKIVRYAELIVNDLPYIKCAHLTPLLIFALS